MVEGVPTEVKPSLDNLSQNNKESASSPPKSPTQVEFTFLTKTLFFFVTILNFVFETDHELWSPGPYIILKAQSSTDDQPPDSKKVSHYPQGATITIERIAELTWCNLVRGQLENGEWLTLEDTEKDEHWAEESDVSVFFFVRRKTRGDFVFMGSFFLKLVCLFFLHKEENKELWQSATGIFVKNRVA